MRITFPVQDGSTERDNMPALQLQGLMWEVASELIEVSRRFPSQSVSLHELGFVILPIFYVILGFIIYLVGTNLAFQCIV